MDLKERFLNFETAKGMYLIPAGFATMYVAIFHIQFVIQAVCCIFGWYLVSEGARKVWVNRIKQAAKQSQMVEDRLVVMDQVAAAKGEDNGTKHVDGSGGNPGNNGGGGVSVS